MGGHGAAVGTHGVREDKIAGLDGVTSCSGSAIGPRSLIPTLPHTLRIPSALISLLIHCCPGAPRTPSPLLPLDAFPTALALAVDPYSDDSSELPVLLAYTKGSGYYPSLLLRDRRQAPTPPTLRLCLTLHSSRPYSLYYSDASRIAGRGYPSRNL